jgi:hypothetical protein
LFGREDIPARELRRGTDPSEQLPDFSADSLKTSGDHLTIETIQLALVVVITVSIVSCLAVVSVSRVSAL